MVVNNASFICSAVGKKDYPSDGLPEVAFAGRSNVGKSSLINAMTNRKSLARKSGVPGKTRTLNFYRIENKLYFVDLPGYGYAKLSRGEKSRIGRMTESYMLSRFTLRCAVLVLDCRHEPSADDKAAIEFFKSADYPVIVAATKADKISRMEMNKRIPAIKASLKLKDEPVLPFSSQTKQGVEELWGCINAVTDKTGE